MPWPNYRPLRGSSVAETAQKTVPSGPFRQRRCGSSRLAGYLRPRRQNQNMQLQHRDIYQAYNAWYGLWPTMPKPAEQEGGDGNQKEAVMEKGRPEQIDKINFNPTGRKTIFQKGKADTDIFKRKI